MSSLQQIEGIILSLNKTMDDAVCFATKELNYPGSNLPNLELTLDVLLLHWRKLDHLIGLQKQDGNMHEILLRVKEEWIRQISHYDMILEMIKNEKLFDQNEKLLHLSVILHRSYLLTTIPSN